MSLTFIINNLSIINALIWLLGIGIVIAMIATIIGICIDLCRDNKNINDYDIY